MRCGRCNLKGTATTRAVRDKEAKSSKKKAKSRKNNTIDVKKAKQRNSTKPKSTKKKNKKIQFKNQKPRLGPEFKIKPQDREFLRRQSQAKFLTPEIGTFGNGSFAKLSNFFTIFDHKLPVNCGSSLRSNRLHYNLKIIG